MYFIAYTFILSIILLIVTLSHIFSSMAATKRANKLEARIVDLEKNFLEMKKAESRHAQYLRDLIEKIAQKLNIEVINEIIDNDNIIDINQHKCSG